MMAWWIAIARRRARRVVSSRVGDGGRYLALRGLERWFWKEMRRWWKYVVRVSVVVENMRGGGGVGVVVVRGAWPLSGMLERWMGIREAIGCRIVVSPFILVDCSLELKLFWWKIFALVL